MRVDDPREFIIDCLSDPANTAKQAALGQWLQQSAANRMLYAELKQLWDAAADMPPTPFNREEEWQALSQQISDPSAHVVELKREIASSTREEAPGVTAPFLPFTKYAWVAASLSLIVVTGIYLWTAREQHIAIHALKVERVTLPDGSTIQAQPATTLEYDPAFTRRCVSLTQGEAYFSISPDEKRTFIVQLPRSTVTVLGTSFHVKVSGTTEKVDVREGKVRLTTHTDTLILTRGLAAQVTSAGKLLQPNLSFTNEEAGTVATALSAYFQVNITLPDSTFRKKKITANFQNMSAKEVQQVLNALLEQ
ncbi:FecR family protein [Chitinophaga sancti]|uniref:FecR domain-containing protein n=1 Tax=Chitinophaga sancti TaxID=1004 RepID=A0A1K1M3P7_9BACT|nr:FecR domain-containing protein [Chitinophaga sancti]WQD64654.1 FecR domain-containing protein [Chitinophaga sancti]WQG89724.1 FecR domain-containing protein [Chitinophaga sancti]SFW17794.1 FecR family protein [Chitinophaga sancti]